MTGCVAPGFSKGPSLGLADQFQLHTRRYWTLSDHSHLYLAYPAQLTYSRSLRTRLQSHFSGSLERHFAGVEVALDPHSLADNLRLARERQADFLLVPTLLDMENRLDSWLDLEDDLESLAGMGGDRAELKIVVYDVMSGDVMDVSIISAKGSWLNMSGQRPESLLSAGFELYARSLRANQAARP
ncbi:DUF4823 domain-containing protein [Pseudomaricurvus alkylphenolicus]|uniref:DUF4823 domain-containing protein n=1 Tax=Pseudomaricurvus alkylphenolicus TaxID=1306991 RepID=UPI001421F30D|nr:DUF4823 domain-containing protein [Pseudomaricurvus alkylphenolicus]NIB41117.1 DUF4823 domain-containing protein [Pseudomaricurvus alkylphenolicus]